MRKILVVLLVMVFIFSLVGCGHAERLQTPTVRREGNTVTWDADDKAEKFEISLDGKLSYVENTVTSMVLNGGESFKIRAIGDGVKYQTSYWSNTLNLTLSGKDESSEESTVEPTEEPTVAPTEEPITDKAFYDYYNSDTGKGTAINMSAVEKEIGSMRLEDFVASDKQSDYVLIKIKNYGEIVIVLRSDVAPITVENFKKLVNNGFYTDTVFHRIIENFMVQGGGYTVDYEHKEASTIKGEFTNNGFENNLKHIRGVIAMARTNVPDSASSQFYIVHKTNRSTASLDTRYATFGYVLVGLDVVDAIATCEVVGDANAPIPVEDIIIVSVTVFEPK